MKIITIVGARPQFVKAAAVSREIKKHDDIQEVIVHTGQHYDANMSDIFFDEMEIPKPDYFLDINGLNHGAMTGQMLLKIEEVILKEKPDWVMVYGDTNSTLAGALAASKLHVRVAHVEAGLRSFNMKMPEEINRVLTDRVSSLLLCPTETAVKNLQAEGYERLCHCRIEDVGDVMQDAALFYAQTSEERSQVIAKNNLKKGEFILGTIHRAENTDRPERLRAIVDALNEVNKSLPVFLPLHPRTKNILAKENIRPDFTIVDPVGYFDMIELLKNCRLVMTDSGGLQKEAFFFGKHCVTLRDETEWVELIESGYNVLAGASREDILSNLELMMKRESDFSQDLYGGGKASANIVKELRK